MTLSLRLSTYNRAAVLMARRHLPSQTLAQALSRRLGTAIAVAAASGADASALRLRRASWRARARAGR